MLRQPPLKKGPTMVFHQGADLAPLQLPKSKGAPTAQCSQRPCPLRVPDKTGVPVVSRVASPAAPEAGSEVYGRPVVFMPLVVPPKFFLKRGPRTKHATALAQVRVQVPVWLCRPPSFLVAGGPHVATVRVGVALVPQVAPPGGSTASVSGGHFAAPPGRVMAV